MLDIPLPVVHFYCSRLNMSRVRRSDVHESSWGPRHQTHAKRTTPLDNTSLALKKRIVCRSNVFACDSHMQTVCVTSKWAAYNMQTC
jgi:hypothetical protein